MNKKFVDIHNGAYNDICGTFIDSIITELTKEENIKNNDKPYGNNNKEINVKEENDNIKKMKTNN